MADEVSLKFPASFEYIRLARLVASGLAAQVNFNLDDIEDLRIAVDELCSALVEAAVPQVGVLPAAHLQLPLLLGPVNVNARLFQTPPVLPSFIRMSGGVLAGTKRPSHGSSE